MFPLGAITIYVTVSDYPQQIIRDVTFLVVDCSSTYNSILKWPTLNFWKAATSTYHLMIKFPTEYGVRELYCGSQVATRECCIAMLEMDDYQAVAEPVKELKEVVLDDSRPDQKTRIGTLASWPVR